MKQYKARKNDHVAQLICTDTNSTGFIRVVEREAKLYGKCSDVAIHALNPNDFELDRHIEDADAQGFSTVVVYK